MQAILLAWGILAFPAGAPMLGFGIPHIEGATRSPRVRAFEAIWSRNPARASKQSEAAEVPKPTEPTAAGEANSASPLAVTVLKSGVIEGMAYTLYSDGSIEAELKQGMVRF